MTYAMKPARRLVIALLCALAIILSVLTASSQPAYAAGQTAYVYNSASSRCGVYAVSDTGARYWVGPGSKSAVAAVSVDILSNCKARWSGTTTFTNGAARIAVGQTTARTIYSISK